MREMARLQTFPDDVEIAGSVADAQRQLGNAVPSLLAEVLARAIAAQLLRTGMQEALPKLVVQPAEMPPPAPRAPAPVPEHFLGMRGDHEAHPGTGKGRVRQRGVNLGRSEVAIGQAALGGICAGSASGVGVGVISSAMPSSCM